MRAPFLGLVLLAGSASPGLAATHEWKGYSITIPAGDVHEEDLSCTAGKLVSGGYVLDSAIRRQGPLGMIAVIANTPFNDSGWYVGFYNSHDEPVVLDFRIAILCE